MEETEVPIWVSLTTYGSYAVLMFFGHVREFYRKLRPIKDSVPEGYAPLLNDFDDFYTRRLYNRIRDAWNRPINSKPKEEILIPERISPDYNKTYVFTGNSKMCINLGSYNYLGFAESPESVQTDVANALEKFGVASCSSDMEMGRCTINRELEQRIARFVGKEDAVVFGMGFATNSTGIPSLVDSKTLIISDHLNHSSLVQGCRSSKAKIKTFRHNDLVRLEEIIRDAIVNGDPRRKRPYSKILIIVEGVYSMEGEIIKLPEIVELKKKYNCYLYLDEAHSIGAMGKSGRGVVEYWMEMGAALSFDDIDVMMGTFTKSFGSSGGYIAGSHDFIKWLRATSPGMLIAEAMCPIVAQQCISSLKVITGEDGTDIGATKIKTLLDNTHYFRDRLAKMNLIVYGDYDSPVVPFLLYHPAKMPAFSRECQKRGLAVVVVGYPATPLIESRCRVCLTSALTRELLDRALEIIEEVSLMCSINYASSERKPESRSPPGSLPTSPTAKTPTLKSPRMNGNHH